MNSFSLSSLPLTVAAFIVVIVILVGVHEWGHFWAARRLGIRVLRFSIGIGKPIWKRTSPKDGVEYVVCAIPLGGYVKLLGERDDNNQELIAEKDLPFSFSRAPVWKRVSVLLAGPIANLILAVFFYWILLLIGTTALKPVIGEVTAGSLIAKAGIHQGDLITAVQGHEVFTREDATIHLFDQLVEGSVQLTVRGDEGAGTQHIIEINAARDPELQDPAKMFAALGFDFWYPPIPAMINSIVPGGAAEHAGLKSGDLILAFDGQPVSDFTDLVKLVTQRGGQTVNVQISRNGEIKELPVTVSEATEAGRKVGKIGIGASPVQIPESMKVVQKYGPIQGFPRAVVQTWDASVLDLKVIGQMLSGKLSVKNLSGPVGIAEVTGEVARQGLLTFIGWLAFFSVNLAILNLLPIPMLDGGQVVYQLIELAKGSPVSERVQLITQQIGIAALIMLVSLTLYNDIARHLS